MNRAGTVQKWGEPAWGAGAEFQGCLAEFVHLDGQYLTHTSFGEFKEGIWVPKEISGLTFGTNGFHLDFSNSGDLGNDVSGNNIDLSTNDIASTDQILDTPTNNFANFSVLNSDSNSTLYEGGLRATMGGGGNYDQVRSDFGLSSGKWYWEVYLEARGYIPAIGVMAGYTGPSTNPTHWVTFGFGQWHITYNSSVPTYQVNQNSGGGTNWSVTMPSTGDVIMVAIDVDNNKIWWGRNGTWYNSSGTANPATGTDARVTLTSDQTWHPMVTLDTGGGGATNAKMRFNFGQESTFQGGKSAGTNSDENGNGLFQYAPPSGYLACCSSNLPEPTIGPNSATQADDHFNTFLYTGTNATNRNIASNTFTPDWVWLKSRSGADNHVVVDVLRKNGSNFPNLHTNTTDAEANDSHPKIITNGVQVSGGLYDNNGVTFVVWNWKAGGDPDDVSGNFIRDGSAFTPSHGTITANKITTNTTAGFAITEFTSNVSSQAGESDSPTTVAHGLGKVPEWVIIKDRDGGSYPHWNVWHPGYQPDTTHLNYQLWLETTNAAINAGWTRADTGMTTNLFCLPHYQYTETGKSYIAYVFTGVEGYSKFGSYNGNAATDGPMVYTGFRPAWVIIKRADSTSSWWMQDTKRSTSNVADEYLIADGNQAESTYTALDFVSNGFKIRQASSSSFNSGTLIYAAFAEAPFKYANAR